MGWGGASPSTQNHEVSKVRRSNLCRSWLRPKQSGGIIPGISVPPSAAQSPISTHPYPDTAHHHHHANHTGFGPCAHPATTPQAWPQATDGPRRCFVLHGMCHVPGAPWSGRLVCFLVALLAARGCVHSCAMCDIPGYAQCDSPRKCACVTACVLSTIEFEFESRLAI